MTTETHAIRYGSDIQMALRTAVTGRPVKSLQLREGDHVRKRTHVFEGFAIGGGGGYGLGAVENAVFSGWATVKGRYVIDGTQRPGSNSNVDS